MICVKSNHTNMPENAFTIPFMYIVHGHAAKDSIQMVYSELLDFIP